MLTLLSSWGGPDMLRLKTPGWQRWCVQLCAIESACALCAVCNLQDLAGGELLCQLWEYASADWPGEEQERDTKRR